VQYWTVCIGDGLRPKIRLRSKIRLRLVDFMKGIDRGLIQRHGVKHCLRPFHYRIGKTREG